MLESAYEQAQIYLIYLLLISVPMFMIFRLRTSTRAGKIIGGLITFTMCLSLSWLLILLCSFFYILNGLFVITLTVMSGLLLFLTYRLYTEIGPKRSMVNLFIGYAAAIFAVTLFSRLGTSNSRVYVDVFDSFMDAVSMSDPEKTMHMLLNIVMFIPFSALYMAMTPSESQLYDLDETFESDAYTEKMPDIVERYSSAALFLGLAYSSIIESSQLVLSMGECDMLDIVSNTLGTLIGIPVGLLVRRFIRYR